MSPVVCSPRSWASHRGPGSCRFRSPIRIYDGNVGVSQVPWKPWWSLSVLFDPGRIRQAEWTMSELPDTAPACVHDEGSKRLVLSGLNHTTFDLTVYASQEGSPHHHARLASGCWSSFARRDSYPQGFSERFPSSSLFLLPKAYLTQGHHTHLSCFLQGTELRDSLGFGERSPRSDAVGVSVIPTAPAPFVANAEPLERSQAWWIGGERHSHEVPVQGRNGTLGSGWFRQNEPIAIVNLRRSRSFWFFSS